MKKIIMIAAVLGLIYGLFNVVIYMLPFGARNESALSTGIVMILVSAVVLVFLKVFNR